MTPVGVGFVGAGPVVQAIHLPTLARLPELFRPVHVMDIDETLAARVAAGVGAASSADLESLLADPAVEVVVIATPHGFHADQVERVCGARVRAVLCEKPLAMDEEEVARVERIAIETGVPLFLGAMHTVDPAWAAVRALAPGFAPHTVRSSIVLTPNARSEEYASEVISRPTEHEIDPEDPREVADLLHGIVMGLAIHDLPLVRALCTADEVTVLSAEVPPSGGYRIIALAGATRLILTAVKTERWRPEWRLEAWESDRSLTLEFPPPYVHAGSGIARVTDGERSVELTSTATNGYEQEWRAVAAVLDGSAPFDGVAPLLADARFAIAVADGAAAAGARAVARRREAS